MSGSSSSPQSNFTKVTSKKSRGRRGKEEVGKPPPSAPSPAETGKPLARSRDYDSRNKQEKDSGKPRGEAEEATEAVAQQRAEKENFPRLEKSDFPALPGGTPSEPTAVQNKSYKANFSQQPCKFAMP